MRVLFALLALAVTVSAQGLTGPNFYIINGDGTDYTFSIDGVEVKDPELSLTVGTTYKFFLNLTAPSHPFGFSANNDSTITMSDFSSAATGGVTSSGSCVRGQDTNALSSTSSNLADPCIISITPPASIAGQSIYYRCSVHPPMVGMLNAVAATGGSTTTPPSGTTAPPSATTAPPTSTGKNSAALVLPGATAFIIAAVNSLFNA